MFFKNNRFYSFKGLPSGTLNLVEELLLSEPLTASCLDVLGSKLLSQLEFGFFDQDFPVIKQGDNGESLFMLCSNEVEIVVNKQIILRMTAPSLLGDKGLLTSKSLRAATVVPTTGNCCLFLKIPIGNYLRNYKDPLIKDGEFVQESQIFSNLFYEIQYRLFKYSYMQQNLWVEVTTAFHSLNVQLITHILEKGSDNDWGEGVWEKVEQFINKVHRYSEDTVAPLNNCNFIDEYRKIFDRAVHRSDFHGTDRRFKLYKSKQWKKWLRNVSEVIVSNLSHEQLPVNLSEVELINPRIYKKRMQSLLRSIEERFMFKTVQPKALLYDRDKLHIKNFFGLGDDPNEFDLHRYQETFLTLFFIKYPNRIMAQIAQKSALVAANCEDDFDDALFKVKMFLDKLRKIAQAGKSALQNNFENVYDLRKSLRIISQAYKSYHQQHLRSFLSYGDQISFSPFITPNLMDLVKRSNTKEGEAIIKRAFFEILDILGLSPDQSPEIRFEEMFHICSGFSNFRISSKEFSSHYWIPISDGFMLMKDKDELEQISPGCMLGGEAWDIKNEELEGDSPWHMQIREGKGNPQGELILVLPKSELPWVRKNDPTSFEFDRDYLPILDWLVQKRMMAIGRWAQTCETLFSKWAQVIEVVTIEWEIRSFENSLEDLNEELYDMILAIIYETIGLQFEIRGKVSSKHLCRELYNQILKQTKDNFPRLPIEKRANKAYTLSRYVLSEIINTLFIGDKENLISITPPQSVFEDLEEEMQNLFAKYSLPIPKPIISLDSGNPNFDLTVVLKGNDELSGLEKCKFAFDLQKLMEMELKHLIVESMEYQNRLKNLQEINTDFDFKEAKTKSTLSTVQKLENILRRKVS